ncbi:MBL fold metallo-hydrolase [Bifidobacterium bombi]|uniref:Beta-lactamase domain protein n=1 Tax=Bifidobacterium bombi DSM 19703 TaxID=1341695 RepID=A0A080N5R8_9BIFI|nr:MBL fold metallo-hydrolase [Bifidobacterium bombi]KFF30939.1 beta-lactamase domain protein [Bifidobacterium bombi DSM 19703]
MKLQHLGTAAAERIPGIFCMCDLCMHAREVGGKEIRTQSQALIDDSVLLDFPGDTYFHYIQYKFDLPAITTLFVTHWHSDHFYGEDLAYRMSAYANDNPTHMDVYGSEAVGGFYERAFFLEEQYDHSRLSYHVLRPGDSVTVKASNGKEYTVYAFEAKHGHDFGDCLFYGITDGHSSVLYAHDTCYFHESAWKDLAKAGLKYDYVSLDCTHALVEDIQTSVHMRFIDDLKVRDRLVNMGLADSSTIFVANHFSHNGLATYEQMQAAAVKEGFISSYDGMTTEF